MIILGIVQFLHIRKVNLELDKKVHERTEALFKANETLKDLAHKDSLTGIHNRGYFMELAEQMFKVAKRNETPLQILSLDIDHFKEVNDTYGHQTGDAVLKLFSNKINTLLRESDVFGRIGGEEFVICLQNTTHEGALAFAEKILKEVRTLQYKNREGKIISFTVSIGMSELQQHKSFTQLLRESDEALYRAKKSGRDCVRS